MVHHIRGAEGGGETGEKDHKLKSLRGGGKDTPKIALIWAQYIIFSC